MLPVASWNLWKGISLVADDEGEWTNRMQGGRDAQTYLEKDAGGKRCPNIPGESHWKEEAKNGLKILYFWEFCLSISFEHYFENWVEFGNLAYHIFLEDISFSVQLARNEMWGDFVVLGHRPIWSAWQQREVSISLDDIIFNVYLIRCMKLCVLQIHTLLLVSSCCFIQFMSVYVSVLW